jgi:hypothetical protein
MMPTRKRYNMWLRRPESGTKFPMLPMHFIFYFFIFSAARARAHFREVVLHGTKDVENKFRVSETKCI